MPRLRRYGSEAEKQAAYRARKKGLVEKEAKVQTKDLGTDGDLSGDVSVSMEQCSEDALSQNSKRGINTDLSAGGDPVPAQTLSRTDEAFDEDRPDWYVFGNEEKEGNCWKCGKKYTTRLELNRFCGPKCKHEYLDAHFASRNQP